MNPGPSAVWVGLFASISAILLYIASHRLPDRSRHLIRLARVSYLIAAVSVLTAFTSLVWIITHHEFQYKYVWEHSARDLSPFYLFASTWSGQEGSFLLWAVWTSLIGILLMWKAGAYENRVMPIFISVIGFLCAILAKQTPFSLFTAHELLRGGLPPGVMAPPDGAGLNPSLQNYWMAIHPPHHLFRIQLTGGAVFVCHRRHDLERLGRVGATGDSLCAPLMRHIGSGAVYGRLLGL